MPYNGSGVFTRLKSWVAAAAAGLDIDPATMDQDTNDIAGGLSNCVTRDGQGVPTADLPMGGHKLTGLGAGASSTDAANFGQVQSLLPSGMCASFWTAAAPAGWLVCDGSAVSRTLYPALFAAIGGQYGNGDGSTTFNLPDARGRVIASVDAGAGRLSFAVSVGQGAGEQTHVLSNAEMPTHNHANGGTTGNEKTPHTHGVLQTNGSVAVNTGGSTYVMSANTVTVQTSTESAGHAHDFNIQSDGGGGAHNNVQPTIVALICIKT